MRHVANLSTKLNYGSRKWQPVLKHKQNVSYRTSFILAGRCLQAWFWTRGHRFLLCWSTPGTHRSRRACTYRCACCTSVACTSNWATTMRLQRSAININKYRQEVHKFTFTFDLQAGWSGGCNVICLRVWKRCFVKWTAKGCKRRITALGILCNGWWRFVKF